VFSSHNYTIDKCTSVAGYNVLRCCVSCIVYVGLCRAVLSLMVDHPVKSPLSVGSETQNFGNLLRVSVIEGLHIPLLSSMNINGL
jgi:hypothetical protein